MMNENQNNINIDMIIQDYKNNIQQRIEMEERKLKGINTSEEIITKFLSDYNVNVNDNDLLESTIAKIEELKNNLKTNDTDISNIKQSMTTLSTMTNVIDNNIINQLGDKINEINSNSEQINESLSFISSSLDMLLNIEIVCPQCNGKKDNNNKCSFCQSSGVVTIQKVLEQRKSKKDNATKETKYVNQNINNNTVTQNSNNNNNNSNNSNGIKSNNTNNLAGNRNIISSDKSHYTILNQEKKEL